jgi:hypothetical protein
MAPRVGAPGELRQETGLPDARLAHDLDRGRTPSIEVGEQTIEGPELVGTSDEGLGKLRQKASLVANIDQVYAAG